MPVAAPDSQRTLDARFVVKSWQTEQGLPINSVTAIAQTADGYLWLGTGNGVVRFDGVRFKAFGLNDGLESIAVGCLLVDRAGVLWVGTFGGGLSRWNGAAFQSWTSREGLAGDNVAALLEDAQGTLWVGTWTGLSRWRAGKFTTITDAEGLEDRQIQALGMDHESTLWVATSPGGLFQRRDGRFVHVPGPASVPMENTRSVFADRHGQLWVGIGDGPLLCRRGREWTVFGRHDGLPGSMVAPVAEGQDGTLWAKSDRAGLYCRRQGRFVPASEELGLSHAFITSVFVDLTGNIWVGTRRDGLHRLSQAQVTSYGAALGLPNDKTLSVGESADGSLWVGTFQNGVYRRTGERFEPFSMAGESPSGLGAYSLWVTRDGTVWCGADRGLLCGRQGQFLSAFEPEQFGSVEAVRALAEDRGGALYVGTAQGRVLRVRDGTLSLVTDQLAGRYVTALAPAPDGSLWVGTGGGLWRLTNGQVSGLTRQDGLLSNGIRALYLGADLTLWIGTAGGGLSRWQNGRLRTFTTAQGLPDNIISQILQDDAGDFWFGCSRGIFRVRQAEIRDLAAGRIAVVHPWLLGRADGMAAEECTGAFHPACLKTSAGRLCFTTTKGLVVVDPKQLHTETARPRVVVEELLVDGEPVWTAANRPRPEASQQGEAITPASSKTFKLDPFNGSTPLSLPPGRRRLEFRYTGLGVAAPERLNFRFRLKGVSADWLEAGTRRTAFYDYVPPGFYQFQVAACNSAGQWSTTLAELAFTVQPFWWQTWWFFLCMMTLLIVGSGGAVWRLSRARLQRAQERELVARAEAQVQQQRHEIIHLTRVATLGELSAALAHELNQPLTAILSSAQAGQRFLAREPLDVAELREILKDIVADDKRAGEVIRRLRGLLKKGEAQAQAVDVNEVIRDVLKLLNSDLVTRQVALVTELAPALPAVQADPVQIQQVLLNLVLNACDAMSQLPSASRTLTVRSHPAAASEITVSVADTGSGIAPAQLEKIFEPFFTTKSHGLGMGLSLSHSIILAHGGRLWATNNPDHGATLHFTLPVAKGTPS